MTEKSAWLSCQLFCPSRLIRPSSCNGSTELMSRRGPKWFEDEMGMVVAIRLCARLPRLARKGSGESGGALPLMAKQAFQRLGGSALCATLNR